MKIIIVSICIVAFLFCLAGIVIGFYTDVRMICEAREDKKKQPAKNYNATVNRKLTLDFDLMKSL